jgi:hypothetical protein
MTDLPFLERGVRDHAAAFRKRQPHDPNNRFLAVETGCSSLSAKFCVRLSVKAQNAPALSARWLWDGWKE